MARFKTTRQREAAMDARLGVQFCNLDLGGDAPAPDPLIGQAAQTNAAISKEALDYYKAKDIADKPYRDEAIKLALDQARTQADTSAKQNAMADETYNYTKGTFRPLEQKIASDALGYDTPERRNAEAAQAQADVGTAADAARLNMARDVASRGGDVNSGNFAAGAARLSLGQAASAASAGNMARKSVEAVGAAKLADAANLGRGIASTNATQTQLGLNAGNSAVANSQVPLNIGANQVQQNNQTSSTAIQGNSSAGNLMLGQYQAQNAAENSNSGGMGALGNVAGALITKLPFSDKNMKDKKKPVGSKASLAAVRKIPVSSWKYKAGSKGDDGRQTHVGPMAQDVQASLGDATAPGGKRLDLISMNGHLLNAVKELDKKVTRLADAKRA